MHHQSHARAADVNDRPSPAPWMLVAEIEHRVANEYALAVASISLAAARVTNLEARAALRRTAQRLRNYADVHRSLQAPTVAGNVDLAAYVSQLCRALTRARLDERLVSLSLVAEGVSIESHRCWRVGLIISELVTNCIRHGLDGAGGEIAIRITRSRGSVLCTVSDNGRAACGATPGSGAQVVNALAEELGGFVERRHGGRGTSVVLSFPEHIPQATCQWGASRRATEDFAPLAGRRELLPCN
jgi:two-component sensor histidine kinase